MTRDNPQTVLRSPTSRCRAGIARVDVTPPVGIYHRFWGAARHDQAEGVHRPLTATALVIGPADSSDGVDLIVAIDHCLLRTPDMEALLTATAAQTGLPRERITVAFSHTHSGGHLCRARANMPGGDLIGPYLDVLPSRLASAFGASLESIGPAVVTYAHSSTTCDLGQNRDYRSPDEGASAPTYLCGFNPRAIKPLAPTVARFCDLQGRIIATLANYPCHPTTLAWDNRQISPDYVGAMRETVECATGAACLFFLAPCGDIGPKVGFVGDVDVADRNGRQLGYAVLSALESMAPPGTDYHFAGAVISGATIGSWEHRPHHDSRSRQTSIFRKRHWSVSLPYRADLRTADDGRRALAEYLVNESAARSRGDSAATAEARALAERERRLLERVDPLPPDPTYPFPLAVWQMGDAFWVAIEGEPYHALAETLERRFPETPLVLIAVANGIRASYLPRHPDYQKPLYEVEVALLAAGSLETLTEEIAGQISTWKDDR